MRQRERVRIAKRRAEFRAVDARLKRTNDKLEALGSKGKQGKGRRARDDLRKQALGLYQAAQVAKGRLAVAISRPVEEKLRDIKTRPERFRPTGKDRVLAASQAAKASIMALRAPSAPRDARAFKRIQEALANGERPEDVYMEIAQATGLSRRVIFSMMRSPESWGVYAQ